MCLLFKTHYQRDVTLIMIKEKKPSRIMRCQICQILCFCCSSVEVRPQVQQLGNCKEVRNKKMDRECERFLLLSCCFEVSVFEKSEWTAQAEWCKNLAMSSAFHIAMMSKYDGWSVMNAVCIQLHSQVQCFQSDKKTLKDNAWINILCLIFSIFYIWFKDFCQFSHHRS